jgi:hypothetical protein
MAEGWLVVCGAETALSPASPTGITEEQVGRRGGLNEEIAAE